MAWTNTCKSMLDYQCIWHGIEGPGDWLQLGAALDGVKYIGNLSNQIIR